MKKRILSVIILIVIYIDVKGQQNNYPVLFIENKFEKIIDLSDLHIKNGNATFDDFFWNAQSLRKIGKEMEALNVLKMSVDIFPENKNLKLLYLDILFDNNMFLDAEPLIDNMLLIDSLDFNLLKKKILINEFNLKNETAINQLNKAIQYDSLNVFYLSHLGDNYKIIDNIPLSTFYYEKAYQQNTKNQNIAKKLISNYLKTTPEKAIDICDTILKMDSLNIPFLRYKAFAYFKTNKVIESLKEYEKIYMSGDSSVIILKRIGILKYKLNDFHSARPYLKRALKLDSTDTEINFFYGCALANSPKKEEALKYLLKSIKLLEPEKDIVSAIYEHIAFTYRELKAYDQCLNYYLQAYELDPEKKKYLFFIASLYEHNLNEKMKAKEYYEMFLDEVDESDEKPNLNPQDNKYTSTYTNAAKISIERINEELFFEGNLK